MMVISVEILIYIVSVVFSMVDAQIACNTSSGGGEAGICIPIDKCPIFKHITKPYSINTVNYLKKIHCGLNVKYVCCANRLMVIKLPENTLDRIIHPSKNTVDASVFNSIKNHSVNLAPRRDVESIEEHPSLALINSPECGNKFDNKIYLGENTTLGEYPWVVQIVHATRDGNIPQCAGSLISKRYVLTAAHCVVNQSVVAIRLGEHDTRMDPDCHNIGNDCMPSVQNIPVEKILPHSQYNKLMLANDIAVVRMTKDADINHENVLPICLPTTNALQNNPIHQVTITGWGDIKHGKSSPILQKADLTVVSNEECQNKYRGSANITASKMCAGGKEGANCRGDSGGPLFRLSPIQVDSLETFRYVQYGIISFGLRFCGPEPGIHVRVAHYMKWILDQLER